MHVGPSELLAKGCLALGIELTEDQQALFETYLGELAYWNERVNLTGARSETEIVVKHFLDSLSCLLSEKIQSGHAIADIGTGAGFPGVPLKIVRPAVRMTLVDSSKKRMNFLDHLMKRLELEVRLVPMRSEEFGRAAGRAAFDICVARAVSVLPAVMESAVPLLKTGGYLIAQKGPKIEQEIDPAQRAAPLLGARIREIKRVEVPFLDGQRYLAIVQKTAPTPGKYPRRPGIPAKRPLGLVT